MVDSLQIVEFRPQTSDCAAAASQPAHWEVHFSRFLLHRSPALYTASTSPLLSPRRIGPVKKSKGGGGTWISSDSVASLQLLLDYGCRGDTILAVYLGDKRLEEHFLSDLHFTWPQVMCVSGFPSRGSRVVLVSYRDASAEVQKFALRFQTNCEAEAFTNALQESLHKLDDAVEMELPSPPMGSGVSSLSEFVSSETPPFRSPEEVVPAPVVKLEPEYQGHEYLNETTDNPVSETPLAAYPPSFTSLLMSSEAEAEKVTPQPTSSKEAQFKSQIMMYMGDSNFQELLMNMEKVIGELGGDLAL